MKRLLITALITALMSSTALAQTLTIVTDAGALEQKDAAYNAPDYSPFVDRNIAGRVLWGDTHLHTSYSANASYTNTIGDPLLTAHWVDPDFDRSQRAFYYVRVIEIPKPRWTAYDAKFFKVKMPDYVPMTVQDRAYTSPIWYTP